MAEVCASTRVSSS